MKNKNISNEILIFLLILLIIISSFDSFGLCADYNFINNNIEKNYSLSSSFLRVKSQCSFTNFSIIKDKIDITQNLAILSYDEINNTIVANTPASESYPSMIIDGMDGLIAYEYQDGVSPFIYLRNTKNFGQNWSNAYKLKVNIDGIDPPVNSPSLCINPKNGYAYGAFLTDYKNSGIHGIFSIQDISGDLSNIQGGGWDWSHVDIWSFWNFNDITIKYHNYNNVPWLTCFIGSTNFSDPTGLGPVKNAVMYGYLGPSNPNEMWIQWEPEYGNCSNLSVAMSDDSKKIYGISERIKGSDTDLLYFSGSYKTGASGPYLDLDYYNFTGSESLFHPKIYVKGNNIYIAVENNLHEIILYTSNNGVNWTLYNVTSGILPPDSNPKYPLLYVDSASIYCTFIESGNISFISSLVSEINWTIPIRLNNVNNTVVSKYRFSDIFDINHIVWTDIRNGNYDLYSFIRNIPEFDLKVKDNVSIGSLGYPFLQTKNMINFTIINLGEFPVNNVDIIVIYSCINKTSVETDYPGYITFLDSKMEKSFNQYLFRINLKEFFKALISFSGIQSITITVDPDKKYDDKNINDNSVTIPVSYKDIFPRLYFLEAIF